MWTSLLVNQVRYHEVFGSRSPPEVSRWADRVNDAGRPCRRTPLWGQPHPRGSTVEVAHHREHPTMLVRRRGQLEGLEDATDAAVHGLLRHVQLAGDARVAEPLCHQLQDL